MQLAALAAADLGLKRGREEERMLRQFKGHPAAVDVSWQELQRRIDLMVVRKSGLRSPRASSLMRQRIRTASSAATCSPRRRAAAPIPTKRGLERHIGHAHASRGGPRPSASARARQVRAGGSAASRGCRVSHCQNVRRGPLGGRTRRLL